MKHYGYSFLRKLLLAVTLSLSVVSASEITRVQAVICSDFGSVDPDDACALMALQGLIHRKSPLVSSIDFSIVTEHVAPLKKAQALSTIFNSAPIYVGSGYDPDCSLEELQSQTPLFPTEIFGMPVSNSQAHTVKKQWHPTHLKAYDNLLKQASQTPHKSGVIHLTSLAEKATPENLLHVFALSPMLTLATVLKANPSLGHNIVVYSMGGCQENNRLAWHSSQVGSSQEITAPGYNWGISPVQTNFILSTVQKIIVVSSQLPRDAKFTIRTDDWALLGEHLKQTERGQAFLNDRSYCNKGNVFDGEQTMCDPMTLIAGLLHIQNPKVLSLTPAKVTFPQIEDDVLEESLVGSPYFKHKDLMSIKKSTEKNANALFLKELPETDYRKMLVNSIKDGFTKTMVTKL